jgi:hypothetical protein
VFLCHAAEVRQNGNFAGTGEELDADLKAHTPDMLKDFSVRWGKHHHCGVPGTVLLGVSA